MKLLDVMKKYDRCVVRESAKLTKIYNLLLKESAEADDIDEAEVCPDCGNDPCTCESEEADSDVDEAKDVISAEEFFAEAEKAKCKGDDCDESEDEVISENDESDEENLDESEDEDKDVDESEEMMSAEEFFAEAEKAKCKGDDCDESEETDSDVDEAEDMISAEEFFSEDESEDKDVTESEDKDKDVDEAEEMMSAEEFFSEDESEDKDVDETEEVEENDMLRNRPHNAHIDDPKGVVAEGEKDDDKEDKEDLDESEESEEDEKKLEESLKSYRRANH